MINPRFQPAAYLFAVSYLIVGAAPLVGCGGSSSSGNDHPKGEAGASEAGAGGADDNGGAAGSHEIESGGVGGTGPAGPPAQITGTFLTTSPANPSAQALSSKSFRIRVDSTEPIVSSGTMYGQHFTISTSIIE